uniref:Cysteine-rich protein 2-like n=1 Tax=Sphaeramia orbicularis TaxID=375764 RepID=A0A673C7Z6_9TELE
MFSPTLHRFILLNVSLTIIIIIIIINTEVVLKPVLIVRGYVSDKSYFDPLYRPVCAAIFFQCASLFVIYLLTLKRVDIQRTLSLYFDANSCFHSSCTAEKVSSLGKDWHKFCLKCERCNKTLNPGGHAEHDGKPFCHKPCYAALFGPKGVNIGGAGSYVYDTPVNEAPAAVSMETDAKPQEEKKAPARGPVKAASFSSFSGGPNICPRCNKTVYFAEKVSSLGKNWHRPCLRCERCSKTLAPGSHAEHDGQPYCHKPCYAVLFGPKGVNTGGVGSYIYDDPEAEAQP